MNVQDTGFCKKMEFAVGKKILDLSTPKVMGILNVTPDSFYDGGKYNNEKEIIKRLKTMVAEGVDIIDIGACSTRPEAKEVSEEEEIKRLIPAIRLTKQEFPDVIISADTFRSQVSINAVDAGADIINDISGGTMDNKMFEVIAKLNVPYILMHIKGIPETMQVNPEYINVIDDIKEYFNLKINELKIKGINKIMIDPGFGFGKNLEQNYQLLKELKEFKNLGYPLLVGVSRKSMINKILNTKPKDALNGTTVINTIALMNGANIIRTHDIKETREAIKLVEYYTKIK